MTTKNRSKRLVLINRDFQLRYTRASVAIGIVSTILTSVVILYPLYLFKVLVVPQFLPAPILAGMFAAGIINVAMLVLFGILISHKIAGPMFSMVRHLRKMSVGQWRTQMRLRPGDDLHFIVRNLNELSTGLVQLAEQDLKLIDAALDTVGESSAAGTQLIELRTRIANRINEEAGGTL